MKIIIEKGKQKKKKQREKGFLQLMCKASLIFKSNLELDLYLN